MKKQLSKAVPTHKAGKTRKAHAITRAHLRAQFSKPAHQYGLFMLAIVLSLASGWAVLYVSRSQQPSSANHRLRAAAELTLTDKRSVPPREIMSGQLIAGKQGVVLTVSVTNNTSQTQMFIPVHQTFVRDALGNSYPLTPLGEVTKPIAAGKLKSGESRSGEISFIVPADANQLRFYFDSRWSDAAPVVVDL